MSGSKEKGKISQKVQYEIEWTIEDIFSYVVYEKMDDYYFSPTFLVPGSKWYLKMYPNGETKNDSVGCISLYLVRGNDDPVQKVNYDLGVRKVDGTIEVIRSNVNHVFDEESPGWGFPKFLERWELFERKSELAPAGVFTVTCTMRVKDVLDSTSRLIELSDDFKNMYLSKGDCDVTLKVQDNEFPVHKNVLSSRCTVFKTMFRADMKEKNTGTVDIVDCDPKAFKDFLVFVYSGRFENSSGDVTELYKIAHKYCVESLKSACVQFMVNSLSVENVLDVFILGKRFDETALKSKSQKFVDDNFADVALTDKWTLFLTENPTLANTFIRSMAKTMKSKQIEKK